MDAAFRLGSRRMAAIAEVGFHAAGFPSATGGPAAMGALRQIVPAEAYELVAYDPATGHHYSLTFDGYASADSKIGAVEYPRTESYRRIMTRRGPLRLNEPDSDFMQSPYFQTYLGPRGWRAGITAPLFLDDGRYTGLVHMSARDPAAFDEETSEVLSAVTFALAHITDVSRCALALGLPADSRVVAYVRGGPYRPVTGWPVSEAITGQPELARVANEFLDSGHDRRRHLWQDEAGAWRELLLVRSTVSLEVASECAVLAERPTRIPYRLSPRELDVLTLVAEGRSNPEIAAHLVLSVRTVTTHIEHIFTKLGCDSRTTATATAVREGLSRVVLQPRT